MKLKNYKERIAAIPKSTRRMVRRNNEILERIHYLLDKNLKGSQKELAVRLGVSDAQISKMLHGQQNFKMDTISKLEIALEGEIIRTVCHDSHPNQDIISVTGWGRTSMEVDHGGKLLEKKSISFNEL